MPHLQFQINKKVPDETKVKFMESIKDTFAQVMDTKTEHIAISLREHSRYNLCIGRADINDDICLMNFDIREGRSIEQRRELVLRYMEIVKQNFGIETTNQYLTFTEHKGEDFHLIEKFLANWQEGEDPLV